MTSHRSLGRLSLACLIAIAGCSRAQPTAVQDGSTRVAAGAVEPVTLERDADGWRLLVEGEPFFVRGVNWRYTPVGLKYDFNAWTGLPREVCERLVDEDAALMKAAGINTIRLIDETGDADFVVRRFHDKHGIRTILNHFAGRYGTTVDGEWVSPVNYADPATREAILASARVAIEHYRDVPGVIAYAFGNEGNYGLEWEDAAVAQLPVGERQAAKARHLYTLLNEVAKQAKAIDPERPTLIVNGDLQYLDLIDELCGDVDILGVNAYRGKGFGDLWERAASIGKPALLIEFGADVYDVIAGRENEAAQAEWIGAQLDDLGRNAHPSLGGSEDPAVPGSALGGTLFQWVDEWWKLQNALGGDDVHDTAATWFNGGYADATVDRTNNMHEEWWGLCRLGEAKVDGLHPREPRRALLEAIRDRWGRSEKAE